MWRLVGDSSSYCKRDRNKVKLDGCVRNLLPEGFGSVVRSLCRAPALSVSGLGARWSFCQGPALFVSGPGSLCVGTQRSLVHCVAARCSLCRGPALSRPGAWLAALCVGAGVLLCVGARRSLCGGPGSLCRAPTIYVSGSGALCVGPRRSPGVVSVPPQIRVPPIQSAGTHFRSACHPSDSRAPSSDPRACHPARRVPCLRERTPNFTDWGNIN